MKKGEINLEFKLPDFSRKDIDIYIGKEVISIRAHKRSEKGTHKKNFYHVEKSSRDFNYFTSVPLINPKKAKIEFKKGILKISAPKI